MHEIHALYLNLKNVKKLGYITYLAQFDKFTEVPRNTTKKTGAYEEYLNTLKEYLVYFMERTRPLHNLKEDFAKSDAEVDRMLAEGTLPGWPKQNAPKEVPFSKLDVAAIDVSAYSSPLELESLGLDRLKAALMALA
ncbi:hypothetical protein COOONC_09015 [Cooperia oncophora]